MLSIRLVIFSSHTIQTKAQAISKGWIKVNGVQVSPNTIIRNQDIISHKIHRHEPPVTSDEIRILSEDKDVIVIDKPGSIPVHPSGRYRHNTVIHILRKERAYGCLHPVNRLDRLTSGLMILALTPQKAQEFESQMQQRSIKKEYICRVLGEFPKGKVICDKPIRTVSNKLGLNVVHESGRACTTVFERVSWNGRTSVIKCFPQTGRTHQIRVHLQYLGHSVCNDALGRALSSILRHRAPELGLKVRSDGYVAVKDLLSLRTKTHVGLPLHDYSVDDLKEAVKRDNKQRFGLHEETGQLLIRANQGHSLNMINSEELFKPILSAEEVPVCIHGTYKENFASIKKEGLRRMTRNHIHFATGQFKEDGVISGMRGDCEVLIHLNVSKYLNDGMKLYRSENGVILAEGRDGVVLPKYFADVDILGKKINNNI